MTILVIIATAMAAILLVPSLVFLLECLASLLPLSSRSVSRPPDLRAAVLVPAHNEEASIHGTVTGLLEQVQPVDRVVVVADNCNDRTAAIAEDAGADVIVRQDPSRRGKGYALAFGVEHLQADPPDVVVVVDADCRLGTGSLDALIERAVETNQPVQADNVSAPAERSALSMISALAMLVRNRVRPRGLLRMGLPCHLMGTGMAFPWVVLRDAPHPEGELVEDLWMGIQLSMRGYEPVHCIEAIVCSVLPEQRDAATSQRRRWEHGQLGMLVRYGPKMIWQGLRERRPSLIALGLDLIVPPLALLVLLHAVVGLIGVAVFVLSGSATALTLTAAGFAAVSIGVVLAWLKHGRRDIPLRYLLLAPVYLLWKVPLYFALLVGRRQAEWQRTQR